MFNYKSYKSDAERSLSAMMWMDRVRWALVLAVVIFHFPTVEHLDASNDVGGDGWQEFGDHWYKKFDDKKTWMDAMAQCNKSGAYLVVITSQEENEFILERSPQLTWIGLRVNKDHKPENAKHEDKFWWEAKKEYPKFTGWGGEEPNDYGGNEDCVDIVSNINYNHWLDDECSDKVPYWCEREPEPSTSTKEPSTVKEDEVSPTTKGPGTNVAAIGEPMIFLIVVIGAGAVFAAPMLPGAEMAF